MPFSPAAAAFAGWGKNIEIPTISSKEYRSAYYKYILKQLIYRSCKFRLEAQQLVDG